MEKRELVWDLDKTIKLIKKVEEQRLLWDTHDIDFLNIVKKRRVFSEIGTDFSCNGSEVERKWRELRNQYRREKLQCSTLTAASTWFAYEHMRFVDTLDTINSLVPAPKSLIPTNSSVADAPNTYRQTYSKLQNNSKNHLSNHHTTAFVGRQKTEKDEFEIFAAGVAAKLRKIQDPRVQLCVQRDIDNTLYEAIIRNVVPKRSSLVGIPAASNGKYKMGTGRSSFISHYPKE